MSIKHIFQSKIGCFGNSVDSEKEVKEFKGVKIEKGLNIDGFKFYRMLGKGAYAKVRVAAKKDSDGLFAIKCYNKQHIIDKKAVTTVLQERKLLSLVCHPFCIYLHWSFQTDTELFLVMNLLPGGDLRFHFNKNCNNFSYPKVRFYLAQIALAIEYLHSLQIVHRDIKPENIGLDSKGNAVLMDMGLARRLNPGQQFHDKTGSAPYIAPEVWTGLGYTYSADWWSLGVTFYELMVGQLPFALNPENYKKGIVLSKLNFPETISPIAVDFLSKLLEPDPSKRIGCGALGFDEIKSHAFFEGLDFDKLVNGQLVTPFVPKNGIAYCDPNLDATDVPYHFDSKSPYAKDLFDEWDCNVAEISNIQSGEGNITGKLQNLSISGTN